MKKLRLHLARRRIVAICVIWPVLILISLGIAAWRVREANLGELQSVFPEWRMPAQSQTVVVFAPHCDDEVLGTGGMIRQALKQGANVWVIIVTNGDGFRAAAAPGLKAFRANSSTFVKFGYKRQAESLSALAELGVPKNRVIFLGYPDRGTEKMWTTNWNTPFRSAYTHDDHSPYVNSYTRNAPYTGRRLTLDIEKILVILNPDQIYMPYPNDQHSDHWATSAFVSTALYDLGYWGIKTVGMYLVHRGDWPVPQGMHPNIRLAPPAALTTYSDTQWYKLPLEASCVTAKRQAVSMFKSQPPGTQRFLSSFVRQTEIFAVRNPEMTLPRIAVGRPQWADINPIVTDPTADGCVTHLRPSADITNLYAARNAKAIFFRIEFAGDIDRETTYELAVHPLFMDAGTTDVLVRKGRAPASGWAVRFEKKSIELSRPLGNWLHTPLVVSAGTKTGWYQTDRTAYRILTP